MISFRTSARLTGATQSAAAGEFVSRLLRDIPRYLLLLLLIALSVPTALVAVSEGAGWMALPYNLFVVDERLPAVFRLHMLTSGAALLMIPIVLFVRRDRALHRPLGRIAAACVVVGALTALPVALFSESTLAARAGFFAQGIVWLGLVAAGIGAVRRRKFQNHARLMLAMAAVASGAVWVRLTTAGVTAWQLPFDPIYACVAWAGWLVPLALVLFLSSRPARSKAQDVAGHSALSSP